MAVVLQRGEAEAADLEDLHRVAGLGRVVHHERLPDGRFHILLQGVARVALLEELPQDSLPYRRARARVMSTTTTDEARVAREYETLRACYAQVMDRCPLARERLGELMRRVADPGVLADVVCASELEDPCTRQGALEECDLVGRLQRASEALAALLLGNLKPEDSLAH